MNNNIMAKNFNLFNGAREHIDSGLADLNSLLSVDTDYRVHIKKHTYGEYECTIAGIIDSKHFSVKATRDSVKYCIEAAIKAMKEAVLEYRSKVMDKRVGERQAASEAKKMVTDHYIDYDITRVTDVNKRKEVQLTPISDDEAIECLNNSDYAMYMYLDEMTLEVKGIYNRGDGYGVITFKAT